MSRRSSTMFLIFTITIIISFTLQTILNSVISATQNVGLSVTPKPEIDVILTKGQTGTSLTYFERDLREALKALNVDNNYVNISAVDTVLVDSNDADAATIFNTWEKYPNINDSKFQANWQLSGQEIYTTANVHWTGFWNKKAENDSDYTIEFDVENRR